MYPLRGNAAIQPRERWYGWDPLVSVNAWPLVIVVFLVVIYDNVAVHVLVFIRFDLKRALRKHILVERIASFDVNNTFMTSAS